MIGNLTISRPYCTTRSMTGFSRLFWGHQSKHLGFSSHSNHVYPPSDQTEIPPKEEGITKSTKGIHIVNDHANKLITSYHGMLFR